MTERNKGRFRNGPPKSAKSHPPVMVKTESDGVVTDGSQANQFDRTGHVTNGPSLNGTNGGSSSDRQNGVKKLPLLPPNRPPNGHPNKPPNGPPNGLPHCQATKSNSSDSNTSNKSDLCGSLNRPVDLSNGDMEELDEHRDQPNGEHTVIVTHVHVYTCCM